MNKRNELLTGLERYLFEEIGIEFKACLYFFCILFFYACVRIVNGSYEAGIWHMAEMILCCYAMGYFQIYALNGVDEAEKLNVKTIISMFLCTAIYLVVAHVFSWFERRVIVEVLFFGYLLFAYFCAFFVYRFRRKIDEKLLNDDLEAFQKRNAKEDKE